MTSQEATVTLAGDKGCHPILEQDHPYITADIRSSMRAVNGFSNYAEIVNLVDRLQQRGYSDDDIQKMLGANYMRVFAQVWK